jgi:DNA-3-methyladenine glycosylase II
MTTFSFTPQGPYSLAAGIRFLEGFTPANHRQDGGASSPGLSCMTVKTDGAEQLLLAFAAEGSWRSVGVAVRQEANGVVKATTYGDTDGAAVRDQVERILSVDVDAAALPRTLMADPVALRLAEQYPGLRPVCFNSPWEAACWAVIGQRIRIIQAASLRARVTRELGARVEVGEAVLTAFPSPEAILSRDNLPGLPEVKQERLRGLARAALAGELDAGRLRAEGPAAALSRLCGLPGIGPFSAELVLIRGAGEPNHFAWTERRLHASMIDTYGEEAHTDAGLRRISDRWRPYRSWICFLHRVHREETTHEIARGRMAPPVSPTPINTAPVFPVPIFQRVTGNGSAI